MGYLLFRASRARSTHNLWTSILWRLHCQVRFKWANCIGTKNILKFCVVLPWKREAWFFTVAVVISVWNLCEICINVVGLSRAIWSRSLHSVSCLSQVRLNCRFEICVTCFAVYGSGTREHSWHRYRHWLWLACGPLPQAIALFHSGFKCLQRLVGTHRTALWVKN